MYVRVYFFSSSSQYVLLRGFMFIPCDCIVEVFTHLGALSKIQRISCFLVKPYRERNVFYQVICAIYSVTKKFKKVAELCGD
jgi:hypothetical protein